MWKSLIALLVLGCATAQAAPLADKDKTALAGEWRASCAGNAGPRFTLEYAVTGGQLFVDAPGTGRMMMGVRSTDAAGEALVFAFQSGSSWSFTRKGAATLVAEAPPPNFADLRGTIFHRCRAPASRAALRLQPDALGFFSQMMPPDYPTFIDAHEKAGCKATSYAYVSIDLVGPEEFAITRGTLRPGRNGVMPALEGVTTWTVNAAEELPNVLRLTITPQKGGPATKISLVAGEGAALLTIPEWDAVYRRCAISDLG